MVMSFACCSDFVSPQHSVFAFWQITPAGKKQVQDKNVIKCDASRREGMFSCCKCHLEKVERFHHHHQNRCQWVNYVTKFFKRQALFAMNLGNLSEASLKTSRMSQKMLTHWHLSATNRNIEKSHTLL